MAPKRKRRRTRVKIKPLLVLGLIIVLLTGLYYSPLTSLSKAAVIGADPADQPQIDAVLSSLNRIPWVQVNSRWVETRIARIEAVDHAIYSQNIFGRGRLEIVYRVPVAHVHGKRIVGLDATGSMYESLSPVPADIPEVMRPTQAKDLLLSIAGGWASQKVAELAVKAKQEWPSEKLRISFNGEGAVCLNIGDGLVIFGACDDFDKKLQALKDALEKDPNLLSSVSLNLTDPTHPATGAYKKKDEPVRITNQRQ